MPDTENCVPEPGSSVVIAYVSPPESAESVSVAARVATAVAPSATFAVAEVVQDGAWSFKSVTVIVRVVAPLASLAEPSLISTVTT